MTHLDLFLQKGPSNGDVVAGLEELRRIVLLDGIPSNSDGMVRHVDPLSYLAILTAQTVRIPDLYLADPPELTTSAHESLPRPRRPGRVTRLRQDSRRHLSNLNHRPSLPKKSLREQPHTRAQRHSMEVE